MSFRPPRVLDLETDAFNRLEGGILISLASEPLKKIQMRIFTFPANHSGSITGIEYELIFLRVIYFKFSNVTLSSKIQRIEKSLDGLDAIDVTRLLSQTNGVFPRDSMIAWDILFEYGKARIVSAELLINTVWEA